MKVDRSVSQRPIPRVRNLTIADLCTSVLLQPKWPEFSAPREKISDWPHTFHRREWGRKVFRLGKVGRWRSTFRWRGDAVKRELMFRAES